MRSPQRHSIQIGKNPINLIVKAFNNIYGGTEKPVFIEFTSISVLNPDFELGEDLLSENEVDVDLVLSKVEYRENSTTIYVVIENDLSELTSIIASRLTEIRCKELDFKAGDSSVPIENKIYRSIIHEYERLIHDLDGGIKEEFFKWLDLKLIVKILLVISLVIF